MTRQINPSMRDLIDLHKMVTAEVGDCVAASNLIIAYNLEEVCLVLEELREGVVDVRNTIQRKKVV